MDQYPTSDKLDKVIKESWSLFKSKFLGGRMEVSTEAPFQHNLANTLRTVGNLHCFSRTEQFFVDLEKREENLLESRKAKYIDITCSYYEYGELVSSAAIELKFKRKYQGADDEARIDAYWDIQCLEKCLKKGYDLAYFMMISNYDLYTKKSREGSTGDTFSMRQGYTTPCKELVPKLKSRENKRIQLKHRYTFHWEEQQGEYFLLLPIKNTNCHELLS